MRQKLNLNSEKIRFLILRTIGNFFVLVSLFGFVTIYGPVIKNELGYRINRIRGVHYIVKTESEMETVRNENKEKAKDKQQNGEKEQQVFFDRFLSQSKPEILVPQDTRFGIIIPKIGANAKVVPNVDPGDYKAYMDALKIGVAHAAGTNFPGMGGNIYLFAHSTDDFWNISRYNAIFFLLKELEEGDEVVVFFGGRRFNYKVAEKKTVAASQVEYLSGQTNSEQLTLQTCFPPGTTWKRLLVIAKPV